MGRRSLGDYIFDYLNYIFLSLLALATLYPFLYVAFASVSNPLWLMQHEGILFKPLGFTLRGYELVFKNPNILTGFQNTLFYVVIGTAVNILFTSIGAYVVSRKNVKYTKYLMHLIVFTMFFSGGLIPFFLLIQNLGLYDKRIVLIVPFAIASWNLIIMRTSFMQLPDSLEESAKIDGANDFTILFRIIIPLSMPVIAVMVLLYAVGRWNEWFMAMVLLRNNSKFPLQLILRQILIMNDQNIMMQGASFTPLEEDMYKSLVQYSTIIVATLPILLLYPFLQRYFVKGIMIGSIKG